MQKSVDFFEEIGNFVFTSKYARFDEKHNRRETWTEAIRRVEKMHLKKYSHLKAPDLADIQWAFDRVRDKDVVPSMRSMQFGGKAIEVQNPRLYNCATRHVDSIRSFSEVFYLLMCGCGVGFGVTKKFIDRLPDLVDKSDRTGTIITYVVQDNMEGWADALEALLNCYFRTTAYTGRKIVFDFSKIRAKGSPIKTGGGKAPGHEGLKQSLRKIKNLLDYIIEVKEQSRVSPINAYDIMMHIADAVLSGGIRRSATIALFDQTDEQMLNAKTNFKVLRKIGFESKINKKGETEWEGRVVVDTSYGGFDGVKYDVTLSDYEYTDMLCKQNVINWRHIEPQRARSNNSVLLNRATVTRKFFEDVIHKIQQYGEPGFVFTDHENFLVNPCAEIGMTPITSDGICGVQFCNLTSINGKHLVSKEAFKRAVKAATIIGTLQAGYTNFKYLSPAAKKITEEEALLGVSITGIMENTSVTLDPEIQQEMAEYACKINEEWSKKLGINKAARITCIKPEGTTSLMLGTSSGIHPHHAREYFRRIQCNKDDNVYQHFAESNPHVIEPSVWSATNSDDVITFPLTVSDKAIIKEDLTALQHLKWILSTQKNWVLNGETDNNTKKLHHNVSCTVIVDTKEWDDVIDYIYEHRKYFTAVSFIPKTGDKIFKQAPNEAVTSEEDQKKFKDFIAQWKKVDYTQMIEKTDETALQEEVACAGGVCELTRL